MSKITLAARDQDCTIRLPGICNFNKETTVFAHLPGIRFGHGTAIKVSDALGAFSCSCCHDAVDGRLKTSHSPEELQLAHYQGAFETLLKLIAMGLIKIC